MAIRDNFEKVHSELAPVFRLIRSPINKQLEKILTSALLSENLRDDIALSFKESHVLRKIHCAHHSSFHHLQILLAQLINSGVV